MQIKNIAKQTGVPAKTIRYYEEIGVLPRPKRLPNGYRVYDESDVERLRLVAGARRLDLSLEEIMAMRERGEAPCTTLLNRLEDKAEEITGRIDDLRRLEADLRELHTLGLKFPTDDVEGKNCVCHLVSERR